MVCFWFCFCFYFGIMYFVLKMSCFLFRYKQFGLSSKPNKSDNGVHASASPFEGLIEKMNWMKKQAKDDEFGKQVLKNGVSKKYLEAWSKDPRLNTPDGNIGSLFDYLEDMDASLCLKTLKEIRSINK